MSELEERRKLFHEIYEQLILPFPPNTVEFKNQSHASAHIPVQAYQHRVNMAAGNHASWRLTLEQPIVHENERLLEMRGVLRIVDAKSMRAKVLLNLSVMRRQSGLNISTSVVKLQPALLSSMPVIALRWDGSILGRKWSKNPGTGVPERSARRLFSPAGRLKHGRNASVAKKFVDEKLLKLYEWNTIQCEEHIPEHVKRKYLKKMEEQANGSK